MSTDLPRILVIDDQQTILDSFSQLLEHSVAGSHDSALDELDRALGGEATRTQSLRVVAAPRYDVRYSLQGVGGVGECRAAAVSGRPFSLAFIDIHMPPGIDGVETAVQLWREQPNLEIVLCTAYSTYSWHDILAKLLHRDQLVILRKPFDPIEVRQLAACLSEKWRRGRALAHRMEELEAQIASEVSRRLQIELARSQKFEALGRLAAGIAHEINTPTQYIQSSLEYLSGACAQLAGDQIPGLPAPQADDIAGAIRDALIGVERVTAIVRSVREYAHTSHARRELVDLNRQIRMAAELARSEYKRDAELILDLEEVAPIPGHADELGRAILNLVVNAAHAIHARGTPAKCGQITIASRATEGGVMISISDTGIGIEPVNRERVFEPFFTTKTLGDGTGQGLAIVRATIVERHHGSIHFDSVVGQGTTFYLSLPRDTEAAL